MCCVRILLATVTPKLSAGQLPFFIGSPTFLPSSACVHLALVHARRYPRQGNFSPASTRPAPLLSSSLSLSLSAWNNTKVPFPRPHAVHIFRRFLANYHASPQVTKKAVSNTRESEFPNSNLAIQIHLLLPLSSQAPLDWLPLCRARAAHLLSVRLSPSPLSPLSFTLDSWLTKRLSASVSLCPPRPGIISRRGEGVYGTARGGTDLKWSLRMGWSPENH